MNTRGRYQAKASRIADALAADIDAGRFPGGSMLPTEADLAARFGAARLTIRRAVEHLIARGAVLRLPHRGVQVVPADGGDDQGIIAGLLASEPDEGQAGIQAGLAAYARQAGQRYHGIYLTDDNHDLTGLLDDLNVDGVVLLPVPADRQGLIRRLGEEGRRPAVCVERRAVDQALPSVECDNKTGMALAVSHLITSYGRPVHYCGMQPDYKTDADRYDGYVRAMHEAGFGELVASHTHFHPKSAGDASYWSRSAPWQAGLEVAEAMLATFPAPISVACLKDEIAWGVYRAAADRGLVIGRDCCVVGFDDLPVASWLDPPLTTVRQSFYEKGFQAGRLLHQLIRRDLRIPLQVTVPVELKLRGSA